MPGMRNTLRVRASGIIGCSLGFGATPPQLPQHPPESRSSTSIGDFSVNAVLLRCGGKSG